MHIVTPRTWRKRGELLATVLLGIFMLAGSRTRAAADDLELGAKAFRVCSACHSLRPSLNMTGPSLTSVWDRKAGSLKGFDRYSAALKSSGVTWNAATLDAWLTSPARFIPGNTMTFAGISDAHVRTALIDFLHAVSAAQNDGPPMKVPAAYTATPMDLKQLPSNEQVTAVRGCRDSYFVTTADGHTRAFWDQSLRFETDASSLGPRRGVPAILPAGMFGDRAAVIFSRPQEISAFIKQAC